MIPTFEKDPTDEDFFTLGWSNVIGEATIQAAEWDVPDGLTFVDDDFSDTTTTVKLSEGEAGTKYMVPCTVETSDNRVLQRSMIIKVLEL